MTAEQIVTLFGLGLLWVGLLLIINYRMDRRQKKHTLKPLYSQGWRVERYPHCITCEGAEEAKQLVLHERRDHGSVRYVPEW